MIKWLLLFLLIVPVGLAVDCPYTVPKVGFVDNVFSDEEGVWVIKLDKGKTFRPWTEPWQLEKFEQIAQDYSNGYLIDKIPSSVRRFDEIAIHPKIARNLDIQQGDIAIRGPPMLNCNYGVVALLRNDKIYAVMVQDKYLAYSYDGITFKSEAVLCDTCGVNFYVNDEMFNIEQGESFEYELKVTLLNHEWSKNSEDSWHAVTYLVEMPKKSLWSRFISWFSSLFSG